MFELKNVVYKSILDIQDLTIEEGKITSIVGPSGCGKTTLLKLLNKMISPDSGEICYQGRSLTNLDSLQLRRKILMLPQSPVIYEGNIRDNLLVGLKFSQSAFPKEEILSSTLQSVGLFKGLNDSAMELSGGEKQRLSLARILLMDGDVYLLDEPSSALDRATEDLILENMTVFIREKHKSLVMVTHSRNIAENFSDNMIEMEKGSVKAVTRRVQP